VGAEVNRPIRWGILGTGAVARGFACGLRFVPHAELVAVASRNRANADRFAVQHEVPRVHGSYDELAADSDVDIVYVATPNQCHHDDMMRCLAAGTPVICEKPFTLDAAEARSVIAEARRAGVFCMEAMWMRFIPAVRRAAELVLNGSIGEVRTVEADFSGANAYDPRSRLFDPQQGGGALLDLGVYTLSLTTMLLGQPDHVQSQATFAPSGVDEQVVVTLGYDSGRLALLTASLRTTGRNEAVIRGSRGSVHIRGPICCPTGFRLRRSTEPTAAGESRSGARSRIVGRLRTNAMARSGVRIARGIGTSVPGLQRGVVNVPMLGNGYGHEAIEAMRCVREGATESPLMPLDETIEIMALMDRCRSQWNSRPGV
jgi:predicted dehydrogenase